MALCVVLRVLLVCLLIVQVFSEYSIPDVTVEVFEPKGLRASLPDAKDLILFAFLSFIKHGDKVIEVSGETSAAVCQQWIVDLPDIKLDVGDEVDYLVFAAINSAGYIKDNLKYKVTQLKHFQPLNNSFTVVPTKTCEPTRTRVRHGSVCAGDTIFEEHFDSLRKDLWQVQQYVPFDHPEMPFVSYQPSTVSVKDGNLRIVPLLQQTQPGFTNDTLYSYLDLNDGCTTEHAHSCYVRASDGATIIPPVVSGRITSQPGFAFTYGTISIRAKLPQGDWIYPEILLEPLIKKFIYGTTNSGMLKIASARGNKELNVGSTLYGNKVLYSGPVIDTSCHDALLKAKTSHNKYWSEDFHVYSAKWTPEHLILSVDDEEYARVNTGMRERLPDSCRHSKNSGLEPFDDHFYITLGLAVGGHSEFPDGSRTKNDHPKPWRNLASKATIEFWKDMNAWYDTWKQPELLVDYVKVVALRYNETV